MPGKTTWPHTRLATVNQRRPFSDLSWGEGGSVHGSGRASFSTSPSRRRLKKPMLEGCYLLAFTFQFRMKCHSFHRSNNSNIPSSSSNSVDVFHVSNLKTFSFSWVKNYSKFFFSISFKEGQQVIGKCGGRCGICRPENDVGLKIELVEGKSWIFSFRLFLGLGRND